MSWPHAMSSPLPSPRGSVGVVAAAAVPALGWAIHALVLHRRLEQARRDPLTGLVTRHGWTRRAARLIRHPQGLVVLLDLNRFKEINDTYGHAVGDLVLSVTAARLAQWCGDDGVAGRIGGDEFVAALIVAADVEARITLLQQALAQPLPGLKVPLVVTASIGYATVSAGRAADLPGLLRVADAAMYAAKTRTRGTGEGSTNGRRPGRAGTHRIEVAA